MKKKVEELTENLKTFELFPIDQLKKENEELVYANALLEEQFKSASNRYEEALRLKDEMNEKYENIEEAMEDKINEFAAQSRLDDINQQLVTIESDFDNLKSDMSRKIQALRYHLSD